MRRKRRKKRVVYKREQNEVEEELEDKNHEEKVRGGRRGRGNVWKGEKRGSNKGRMSHDISPDHHVLH